MAVKKIVLQLCKKERGKRQVNVAQMTEIVGKLSDVMFREAMRGECHTVQTLLKLGRRRDNAKHSFRPLYR